LTQVWDSLERRFGSINESQVAQRMFDSRKQNEGETLQEFETAIKILYKQAYPNATNEQRDSDLKRKFQDGVSMPEIAQHLRVHCLSENFPNTVLRAREFLDAVEASRPCKSVRSFVVSEHQAVQDDNNKNTAFDMQPLINSITAAIDKSVNEKFKQNDTQQKQTQGTRNPRQGDGRYNEGQKEVPRGNFGNNGSQPRGSRNSNFQPPALNFRFRNESQGPRMNFQRERSASAERFGGDRPRSLSMGCLNRRSWTPQPNQGRTWINTGSQGYNDTAGKRKTWMLDMW